MWRGCEGSSVEIVRVAALAMVLATVLVGVERAVASLES